ncbi:MAG: hypothetical protein HBSAPP03_21310 [Phycisphaerae bacterium]|nr:MAG: hypothetical protein HBSAPP03_21310 [Phycisphaerae bacterium]
MEPRVEHQSGRRVVEVDAIGIVRTSRLMLRPLRESDHDEFLRVLACSRDHLGRYSTLHLPGEDDAGVFMRQCRLAREGDARGTAWRRAGFLENGRLVGCFNINVITRGLSWTGDANWWVSADQVGRGLGTEGMLALVDHALSELPRGLGLHVLRAAIMPENVRSVRQVTRAGFTPTGERVRLAVGSRWEMHELYERRAE